MGPVSYIFPPIADFTFCRYATSLLEDNKFSLPRAGKNNDNSHPPIHPTKYANNLQGPQKQIYPYIEP